jgi:branched-chain amino acid transport system substrate-binding protein
VGDADKPKQRASDIWYRGQVTRRKLCIEKSNFRGRDDTTKLIKALEGLEMKEGEDFPQGDKLLRKQDHQAFLREFICDIKGGKHHIIDVAPREKTVVPASCKFA